MAETEKPPLTPTLVVNLPTYAPRPYQEELLKWFVKGIRENRQRLRGVAVWHRRAGKDLTALHLIAIAAHLRVGTYWIVYPYIKQARQAIWAGMTSDGTRFLDAFPDALIQSINHCEMTIRLKNGSIIALQGADHPDSLVGTNPVGVVFSEWSLMKPEVYALVRPILEENKGWAFFIYTPRGLNHGYTLLENFRNDPEAYVSVKTVTDTGVISPEQMVQIRRETDPEMVEQEYFCSFRSPMPGAYFAREMKTAEEEGRIDRIPYDTRFPVHTFWDIGTSDLTAVWWVQFVGQKVLLLRYIQDNGKPISYYAHLVNSMNYNYEFHYAPWEATFFSNKTPTPGPIISRTAHDIGLNFRPIPQRDVNDGINAAREVFPRCYFDRALCEVGLQALREYRKRPNPLDTLDSSGPLRTWACHGSDAFRYMAMVYKNPDIVDRPERPRRAELPNKVLAFRP